MINFKIGSLSELDVYNKTLKARKPKKILNPGKISVVFLTWNRCDYLSETIESFRKHIAEKEHGVDIEMISIDNGSGNNEVLKILDKYHWDISIRNNSCVGIRRALDHAY